mmetsp:Transcript_11791/g.26714  ORF Transcript_11791/g.26714 Transcript_11791/m.26714 type:complete len:219 (+) Transcript_11791:310-966(+)
MECDDEDCGSVSIPDDDGGTQYANRRRHVIPNPSPSLGSVIVAAPRSVIAFVNGFHGSRLNITRSTSLLYCGWYGNPNSTVLWKIHPMMKMPNDRLVAPWLVFVKTEISSANASMAFWNVKNTTNSSAWLFFTNSEKPSRYPVAVMMPLLTTFMSPSHRIQLVQYELSSMPIDSMPCRSWSSRSCTTLLATRTKLNIVAANRNPGAIPPTMLGATAAG